MKNFLKISTYLIPCVIFLLLHTNLSAQWVQTNGLSSDYVYCFASDGINLFAGTKDNGIYRTSNAGLNWAAVNSGLTSTKIYSMAFTGSVLLAGTDDGIFRSTNSGTNWTYSAFSGTHMFSVYSLSYQFAGCVNGVFRSTNHGLNWTSTSLTGYNVNSFTYDGFYYYAGTEGNGVYRSLNNGINWTAVNTGLPAFAFVMTLEVSAPNNVFAGTFSDGAFRSNNSGGSWAPINSGLSSQDIYAIDVTGNNLFAGTFFGGVFYSTNSGNSWTAVNNGLSTLNVRSLFIMEPYIFAGTASAGVWRRPIIEILSSVVPLGTVPESFNLFQNYPNPFNPATNIKFDIPSESHVELNIYDALGRKVEDLVSQNLRAGSYSVDWNASAHPSGVYFYKITAGDFIQTRKMVLLK